MTNKRVIFVLFLWGLIIFKYFCGKNTIVQSLNNYFRYILILIRNPNMSNVSDSRYQVYNKEAKY